MYGTTNDDDIIIKNKLNDDNESLLHIKNDLKFNYNIMYLLLVSFILTISLFSYYTISLKRISTPIVYNNDDCCPDNMSTGQCYDVNTPVFDGLDFVQYFTTFQLPNGLYNESMVGTVGSADYSSIYNGYTFYFISEDNKLLFDQSPSSYIPQYGGFCTWGITDEYGCPNFPWNGSCLGPSGDWGEWLIYNDKLYFFMADTVKEWFLQDPDTNIANGDARWKNWFGDNTESLFSTTCSIHTTIDR